MDRLYVTADEQSGILAQASAALKEELSASEREYAKQMEGKSPDKFAENFERTKKANLTIKDGALKQLTDAMREYKIAHDFGAADTLEGYPQFKAEYEKLRDSELLSYEEKESFPPLYSYRLQSVIYWHIILFSQ